ncbi:hypothetical protein C8A00DRAFT_17528 [Chaetomidium leptoderma]|uniref:Uncharacterized protein n=1 Tax=Chaetomidium leptoderma TaxID=669021 RepID=A0AAN6ZUX4_9PEZI|nr:hypothetical protein C8A00DRAFT_17528 [Chaetomidium leptoderma]
MAPASAIGHKRSHSSVDSEFAVPKAATSDATRPRALIIHLNALLSAKRAITSTIRKTIVEALPDRYIPEMTDEAIVRAFSKTPCIQKILDFLDIRELTPEELADVSKVYRRIYISHGIPLVTLAPHAKEFLEDVKRQGDIELAVMSHNPPLGAHMLRRLGVNELVDTILPTTTTHSQDPNSTAFSDSCWGAWQHLILPWFNAAFTANPHNKKETTGNLEEEGDDAWCAAGHPLQLPGLAWPALQPEQAIAVSCALYDLDLARVVSIKTCWIRKFGQIEDEAEEAAANAAGSKFDVVLDNLGELRVMLFGDEHHHQAVVTKGEPVVKTAGKQEEDKVVKTEGESAVLKAGKHEEDQVVKAEVEDGQVVKAGDEEDQVVKTDNQNGQVMTTGGGEDQVVKLEPVEDQVGKADSEKDEAMKTSDEEARVVKLEPVEE